MKILVFSIIAAVLTGVLPATADLANDKCLVSGKAIDDSATAEIVVAIGACCDKCTAKIEKNPAKYAAAIKEAAGKAVNSKCPYSGKAVDADETASHGGMTIAFCCGKCVKKFNGDPKAALAKIEVDTAGNASCPLSGKKLDPDAVVKISQEYGFCCGKCVKKFEADPAAVLKKAS